MITHPNVNQLRFTIDKLISETRSDYVGLLFTPIALQLDSNHLRLALKRKLQLMRVLGIKSLTLSCSTAKGASSVHGSSISKAAVVVKEVMG